MTTTDTATPTDGAVTSGAARGGAGHWSLIGFFAQGRLLVPPHPLQLKFASSRALPCPTPPVTRPTKPWTTHVGHPSHRRPSRHSADQAVTLPTKPPISFGIFDDALNRKLNDGQDAPQLAR